MPVSMECCTQSGCWKEHPATSPRGRQSPECPLDPHSVTVSDFFAVMEIESRASWVQDKGSPTELYTHPTLSYLNVTQFSNK